MKPMYDTLVTLGLFFTAISLEICGGCSRPSGPVADFRDSTRAFRQMIENPYGGLGLNRAEFAGRMVFTKYCGVCHGLEGDGKGFNAFNLQSSFGVQPTDFTDSSMMAALTDGTMIVAVSKGGRAANKSQYMPPWGGILNSEEVENVVAYVRALPRLRGPKESTD